MKLHYLIQGIKNLFIRDVEILSSPEIDGELFPIVEIDEIPSVIKPGEIKLLGLPIPHLYLERLAANSQKLKLDFQIYTTDAKLKVATKCLVPPIDDIDIPECDWEPFKIK